MINSEFIKKRYSLLILDYYKDKIKQLCEDLPLSSFNGINKVIEEYDSKELTDDVKSVIDSRLNTLCKGKSKLLKEIKKYVYGILSYRNIYGTSIKFITDKKYLVGYLESNYDKNVWSKLKSDKSYQLEYYVITDNICYQYMVMFKRYDESDTLFSIEFSVIDEYNNVSTNMMYVNIVTGRYYSMRKNGTLRKSSSKITNNIPKDSNDEYIITQDLVILSMQRILRKYFEILENSPLDVHVAYESSVHVMSDKKARLAESLCGEYLTDSIITDRYITLDSLANKYRHSNYKGGTHASPMPHNRSEYFKLCPGGSYKLINDVFVEVQKGTGDYVFVSSTTVNGGLAKKSIVNKLIVIGEKDVY